MHAAPSAEYSKITEIIRRIHMSCAGFAAIDEELLGPLPAG